MNAVGPSLVDPCPNASFGRPVRLCLSRDFKRVFECKRSIVGKTMVIWVGAGEGISSRMGVVASKRTFRRAVDRNRAKRLIREAFRLERHELTGVSDLVIVARHRILEAGASVAQAEFLKLAQLLGLTTGSQNRDSYGQGDAKL